MELKTFLFFGRSGCGKGTQVELLQEHLEKTDPGRKILSISTGNKLRKVAEGSSYTGKLVKEVIDGGNLLATFVPIWGWTDELIENFTGEEHLIFDGFARRPIEAPVLHHALKFYSRAKGADVVLMDVSEEWSTERLKGRGREDDEDSEIRKRLDWFNNEVAVSLKFFKDKPHYYNFHTINGEQTVEEVHQEILSKLKIS